MRTISKTIKRRRWNKRGMSSVVGAIFMILIVGMIASAYFMFTLAQNTTYNDAMRSNNQAQVVAMSESVKVPSAANYIQSGSGVQVSVTLTNDGPTIVQIKTLWVSSSPNDYGFVNLDIDLKPGQSHELINQPVNPTFGVLNNVNCYGWVITARGRTFELYPDHGIGPQGIPGPTGATGATGPTGPTGPQGPQGTTSYKADTALVSQGIGSIAMNFTKFRIYDFGTGNFAPPSGTALTAGIESNSYTIHDDHFYAIRIALINMDSNTASIDISSKSYIWGLNPQTGTVKSFSWRVMYLGADNKLYTGYDFNINLPYNTEVYVYFGIAKSEIGSAALPAVVPLNILLFGNFIYPDSSTAEYGQNLPFVALNIPS